ncbi:hypothetical protein A2U01_0073121, partial [Trifolium medium]|nr:hypothetical protein [Trifolium medium]
QKVNPDQTHCAWRSTSSRIAPSPEENVEKQDYTACCATQARALRRNPKVKPPHHKQHAAQRSTIRRAA